MMQVMLDSANALKTVTLVQMILNVKHVLTPFSLIMQLNYVSLPVLMGPLQLEMNATPATPLVGLVLNWEIRVTTNAQIVIV